MIAHAQTDPFLLSAAETATTEAMRADGVIPQDWRYIDIPWQNAVIFDKIVEIGGPDMRVLDCGERDENKRGKVVSVRKRRSASTSEPSEIYALFSTAANEAELTRWRTMGSRGGSVRKSRLIALRGSSSWGRPAHAIVERRSR